MTHMFLNRRTPTPFAVNSKQFIKVDIRDLCPRTLTKVTALNKIQTKNYTTVESSDGNMSIPPTDYRETAVRQVVKGHLP